LVPWGHYRHNSLFAELIASGRYAEAAPQTAPSSHQFEQLVQAVTADHPSKAAQMREWSPGSQKGLLGHLAMTVDQAKPEAERVVAGAGIDVRLRR